MNINFQIHYRAEYGQSLCVIEIQESILGWTEKSPLVLNCQGTDFWQVNVPISDFAGSIRYKYAIRVGEGQYIYEAGEPRILNLVESQKSKVERQIGFAMHGRPVRMRTVSIPQLSLRRFSIV